MDISKLKLFVFTHVFLHTLQMLTMSLGTVTISFDVQLNADNGHHTPVLLLQEFSISGFYVENFKGFPNFSHKTEDGNYLNKTH